MYSVVSRFHDIYVQDGQPMTVTSSTGTMSAPSMCLSVCMCHVLCCVKIARHLRTGWTADDCALIHGHHVCSQLISDHTYHQQVDSGGGVNGNGHRSTVTGNSPPFNLRSSANLVDRQTSLFGLPATDAAGACYLSAHVYLYAKIHNSVCIG